MNKVNFRGIHTVHVKCISIQPIFNRQTYLITSQPHWIYTYALRIYVYYIYIESNKKTPWPESAIPTERPSLVGEVSTNFLWTEGATWSA
jgi:hypothetical protein